MTDALPESGRLGYVIQERLSAATNYNKWIASQFDDAIGSRVLDVGCALGNITQHYLDRDLIVGVDVAADFVATISERFVGHDNFRALQCDAADTKLPELVSGDRIDSILCVNVLEHVDRDDLALANFAAVLRPGGVLCVLVPAFPFLFGSMDRADDHFRRYTRGSLSTKLGAAGFTVDRLRFMNALGILGWLLNGKVLRKSLIPNEQYGTFDRIVPLLRAAEAMVPPPVGLSLICMSRRS